MRNSPGFLPYLQSQLHSLGREFLERINDPLGLSLSGLIDQVVNPQDHTVYDSYEVDERIVTQYSKISNETAAIGERAIRNNEVAFCILAGGAGTRAGGTKALLKIPGADVSLLAVKLLQSQGIKHVWVMTSPSNYDEVRSHVLSLSGGEDVKLFQQFESVRLTPDNQLSFNDKGEPNLYPCGHGDTIPALQKSGILDQFIKNGGKYVIVVNADNVLASPNFEIVGQHIESSTPVTCEVVRRSTEDRGGILCNHHGVDQIVEHFRFSIPLESDKFKWFSTNTYIFKADLDFSTVKWSWHRTKKEVNHHLVVQHERLMQDLTATFQTQFIEVPREERFMPIKTSADLENASRIFRKI